MGQLSGEEGGETIVVICSVGEDSIFNLKMVRKITKQIQNTKQDSHFKASL